jgi:hypothetical protein
MSHSYITIKNQLHRNENIEPQQYMAEKPQERMGIVRKMSPELAKDSPEIFRTQLIDSIRNKTAVGGLVWDAMIRRGTIAAARVTFDNTTWVSESVMKNGTIKLGTSQMADALREKVIFEDAHFRGEQEYTYRFMHEITHLIHPKLFGVLRYRGVTKHQESIELYNLILDMRKNGVGLSSLGSLDFYRSVGPAEQATEDHVELMNMFSIDPGYLQRYLAFLSSPRHVSFREQNSLLTLDVDTANYIFENVKASLEFFLDDSNE